MANKGKRMVSEDLIKKLEGISLNPTYEILNFKNDDSDITFGYINERDPNQFGAKLDRYDAFTLNEHFSGSGYEEVKFEVSIPNADALYPNVREVFYTALGAKVGDTTVYANNKGIIELPESGGDEKHLYMFTIYIMNTDSAISYYISNNYGLPLNQYPGGMYEVYYENEISDFYSSDILTSIANILANIPFEAYDRQSQGIISNAADLLISTCYRPADKGELTLYMLKNPTTSPIVEKDYFSFLDLNGQLVSTLTSNLQNSYDIGFSITQVL